MAYVNDPRNPQNAKEHAAVAYILSQVDGMRIERAKDLVWYAHMRLSAYEKAVLDKRTDEIIFHRDEDLGE